MNSAELQEVEPEECRSVEGRGNVLDSYAAYLTDESKMDFEPVSAIYFPRNTAQVVDAVKKIRARGERIVVSASRTGISGGAVGVDNASIISLERMDSVLGEWRFQAGIRLEDIPRSGSEYYPVDPTEMSASLGGTVATNASGAGAYRYGPTRDHVKALTVVLADGGVLDVERGRVTSENGEFVLRHRDGETVVPVAGTGAPPVKYSPGLRLREGMDLVDLFVGSEGTLGIVTEIGTGKVGFPRDRLFLVVYAASEAQALDLVDAVKAEALLECIAIEYVGPGAFAIMDEAEMPADIPGDAECAVYLEIVNREGSEDAVESVLVSLGLDPGRTWAGLGEEDLQRMKRFRHAVPAAVNAIIAERKRDVPGLHKIGTDNAVPEGRLRDLLSFARPLVGGAGLEYVVFGHIGDNHIHINMMPRSIEEFDTARELYLRIAEESVRLGGTASAEHGIGRLKKNLMPIEFSPDELRAMRAVKDALDPEGVLNPGVLF